MQFWILCINKGLNASKILDDISKSDCLFWHHIYRCSSETRGKLAWCKTLAVPPLLNGTKLGLPVNSFPPTAGSSIPLIDLHMPWASRKGVCSSWLIRVSCRHHCLRPHALTWLCYNVRQDMCWVELFNHYCALLEGELQVPSGELDLGPGHRRQEESWITWVWIFCILYIFYIYIFKLLESCLTILHCTNIIFIHAKF